MRFLAAICLKMGLESSAICHFFANFKGNAVLMRVMHLRARVRAYVRTYTHECLVLGCMHVF